MAVFFHDDIVLRILVHLPTRSLVRFQCVSKHWNRLIKYPYIMKFRSPKLFALPIDKSLHLIDAASNSIVNSCCPTEDVCDWGQYERVYAIGAFNGIVVLSLEDIRSLILYNPLTYEYKKLNPPPDNNVRQIPYGYGFGYGATPDDLKIVTLKHDHICQVFSIKKNTSWNILVPYQRNTRFLDKVGTFLNGFLHWINYETDVLHVLNLKNMMFWNRVVPFETRDNTVLGTIDGCLCLLNRRFECNELEMWVMKEYGWAKTFTFEIPRPKDINGLYRFYCKPLSIMDSGQILLGDYYDQLILYDILNKSYRSLNVSLGKKLEDYWRRINCVEYVETLISPSEICV
ncbi:F-box/kelch-repeat protein At3g06240-like [Rutidosis leptorrhynchoides]|uniref:F-box/kelch-repeat protein At3g06240-like n=1 Tax=Rutidosis leptorrhynchoides TaxID=125765 RepID=UPI003A98F190